MAGLRKLRLRPWQERVLDGCVAKHLFVSLPVAKVLRPYLCPFELVEYLTIFGYSGYEVDDYSKALLDIVSLCPKLHTVEWDDTAPTLFRSEVTALRAKLPPGIDLVVTHYRSEIILDSWF